MDLSKELYRIKMLCCKENFPNIDCIPSEELKAISEIITRPIYGLSKGEIEKFLDESYIDKIIVPYGSKTPNMLEMLDKSKPIFDRCMENQHICGSGKHIGKFIEKVMQPSRYTDRKDLWKELRDELNMALLSLDISINDKGKIISTNNPPMTSEVNKVVETSKKVFIVHGHDEETIKEVILFIKALGLEAIILHEQVNLGKTIIEKLEDNIAFVGFAVVLYTACDFGGSNKNGEKKDRARQNVVFEHGLLIGKLGREKCHALVKDKVEIPSDLQGMIYTSMTENWQAKLEEELKAVGFKIK
jgi:predicted nucleotide-binding protein